MKFFGKILDKKDLTTKEYVDDADTALKQELDDTKVSKDDMSEYSSEEIVTLWNEFFKSSN